MELLVNRKPKSFYFTLNNSNKTVTLLTLTKEYNNMESLHYSSLHPIHITKSF